MTTTIQLYDILESELMKKGFNEFHSGEKFSIDSITFFDEEQSFMKKILQYDDDVSDIVNNRFFNGLKLDDPEHDKHFKRMFLNKFITREINRQTIEAFALQMSYVFMEQERFINQIYTDLEKYIAGTQTNSQSSTGSNTSDNRSAFSQLPQDNVQLDVDSTIMESASDNTISRNKQSNESQNSGETKMYRLDELLKTNGLLDQVLNLFDRKCFLQVW